MQALLIIALIIAGIFVLSYGFAYGGMTIVILLDFSARAFTWLGASSPQTGWLMLGALSGLAAGAWMGLRRAGRPLGAGETTLGITIIGALLLIGALTPRLSNASSEEPVTPIPASVLFRASVTSNGLNIRTGPSSAMPVVTTAPSGAVLEVLQTGGNWYQVRFQGPTGLVQGWASAKFLRRQD